MGGVLFSFPFFFNIVRTVALVVSGRPDGGRTAWGGQFWLIKWVVSLV